jgi:hypothetical protein
MLPAALQWPADRINWCGTDNVRNRSWSRDVSEDIAGEIIDRAYDADETLTAATKRFIDRHVDGKRQPLAASVHPSDETAGKKVG